MKDEEKYKNVLQKVVELSETEHVQTSEEIIQMLIYELSGNKKMI